MSKFPLPEAFLEQMQQQLGEESAQLVAALMEQSPTAIRLHPAKPADISHLPVEAPVPWCSQGRYLSERPVFAADPLWHAGAYYVQEASSMALQQALDATGLGGIPIVALDLCGAPGGKATLLNSWLHPESVIAVNEVIRSRANILADQMIRWGYPNTVVWNQDPDRLRKLGPIFQLITVDAPCSGEGMFRKDEVAIREWSPAHVLHCAARQSRILESAWQLLAPGGFLVYSTCTFNEAENEQQIRLMKSWGALVMPIEAQPEWGWQEADTGGYHLYPHKVRGEGLFIALLQKSDGKPHLLAPPEGKPARLPISFPASWLKTDDWHVHQYNGTWTALPGKQASVLDHLATNIPAIHTGMPLGIEKGKDWIPNHAWALSNAPSNLPSVELSVDDARAFLSRQPLLLDNVSAGWHRATYQGHGLGWLKVIPGRVNNYLPQQWRIRDWDKLY